MAFRTPSDDPIAQLVGGLYYNIDFAVGIGAPNARLDVKLVQALLKLLFDDLIAANPDFVPLPSLPLEVTGRFDSATRLWLLFFQLQMSKRGYAVRVDGRFDPARGDIFQTSRISHTQYAVELLNLVAATSSLGSPGDLYQRFADRPYVHEHPDLLHIVTGPVRKRALAYAHGG